MQESSTAPSNRTGRSGADVVRGLAPTLVLGVIAPLVVFDVTKSHGASDFAAYLWASIGPLLETVLSTVRTRRMDKISAFIAGLTVVSALIAAVGGTSDTLLLLKDSAVTAAFGVVCLVTLTPLVPRPLMFYFAQKFSGGTEEGMERFDALWRARPEFRCSFRVMTAAWGIGYLAEAAVKVIVAETFSFSLAYNIDQVLPAVVFAALTAWTVRYAGRMRREIGRAAGPGHPGSPHPGHDPGQMTGSGHGS